MSAAGDQRGLKSVVAEEFSFSEAMGGVRGMVESVLPGLTFVVVYVVSERLWPPLMASLGLAVILAVARLIGRSSLMGAVSSVGGIALGVAWALVSGKAEGFYAPGLWINGAYLTGCLVSILARWPLVAVVAAAATGQLGSFREDRSFIRRGAWATWLMVGLFAARLAVQLPLYWAGQVALLGTLKLAMGAPPFVALLWLSWLIMRPVLRRPPAPGEREPGGGEPSDPEPGETAAGERTASDKPEPGEREPGETAAGERTASDKPEPGGGE